MSQNIKKTFKKQYKSGYFINNKSSFSAANKNNDYLDEFNLKIINKKIEKINYTDKDLIIINLNFLSDVFYNSNINNFGLLYFFLNKLGYLVEKNKFIFLIIDDIENKCEIEIILNLFLIGIDKKIPYDNIYNGKVTINNISFYNQLISLIENEGFYEFNEKKIKCFFTFKINKKLEIDTLFNIEGSEQKVGFKLKNKNFFVLNIKEINFETIEIISKFLNNDKFNLFKKLEEFQPKHIEEKYLNYKKKLEIKENIIKKIENLKTEISKETEHLEILYKKDTKLENCIFKFLKDKDFNVKINENTNKYTYDLLIKLENNVFVVCEIKAIKNITLKTSYFSQLSNWEDQIKEEITNKNNSNNNNNKIIPLLIFTTEINKKPNERQVKIPTEKLTKIKVIENIKIISTYNLYEILNSKNGKEDFIKKLQIKNHFKTDNKNEEIKKIIEIKL